jgi:hypothetical protein
VVPPSREVRAFPSKTIGCRGGRFVETRTAEATSHHAISCSSWLEERHEFNQLADKSESKAQHTVLMDGTIATRTVREDVAWRFSRSMD